MQKKDKEFRLWHADTSYILRVAKGDRESNDFHNRSPQKGQIGIDFTLK